MFLSKCWMFSWFSCSLDVLHGGFGINKLQLLITKNIIFFCCKILQFLVIKSWILIRIDPPKCWIRILTRIHNTLTGTKDLSCVQVWKDYFPAVDAIVFLIDSCDRARFGESKVR
jgi:hypothetical protein